MHWLTTLRVFNILAICLSAGFLTATLFRLQVNDRAKRIVRATSIIYVMYAFGTTLQVEDAIIHDHPASWKTVFITITAVTGLLVGAWSYYHIRLDEDHQLHRPDVYDG